MEVANDDYLLLLQPTNQHKAAAQPAMHCLQSCGVVVLPGVAVASLQR